MTCLHTEGGFQKRNYLSWGVLLVGEKRQNLTIGEETAARSHNIGRVVNFKHAHLQKPMVSDKVTQLFKKLVNSIHSTASLTLTHGLSPSPCRLRNCSVTQN